MLEWLPWLGLPLAFWCGLALGRRWARQAPGRQDLERRQAHAGAEVTGEAVARERERILRDLHDDVGARLLQLVYAAPTPAFADQARAALQDLRDVVSRSRRGAAPLEEVLCEIESEARQRLAAASIQLSWEQPQLLPALQLDEAAALHLYRIAREAISNALKHAGARTLRIRVRALPELLVLELTDDGRGPGPAMDGRGRGMQGMRQRAEQLHGSIRWTVGTAGGTKVLLSLPLDPASPD